jgi:hypothetical protein
VEAVALDASRGGDVPMLQEQGADPLIGLLSVRPIVGLRSIGVLQHWQSAEHLQA